MIDTAVNTTTREPANSAPPVKSDEIVIFDRSFLDQPHLQNLSQCRVLWSPVRRAGFTGSE
jgi:hypothetical protein